MKIKTLKGNEYEVLESKDIEDIVIIANTNYELIYNHSIKFKNILFLNLGVRKLDGKFTINDEIVVTIQNNINIMGSTKLCGLGNYNNYEMKAVGYTFPVEQRIIVSDRHSTGLYDRAYINCVVKLR